MLETVQQLSHVIVLCEDIDRMKSFYRNLFSFAVISESNTGLSFRIGPIILGLRKRTRHYDGRGAGPESPGVQIAFLVSREEVDQCHTELIDKGVTILDPPNNQDWGHRTVYFSDPEGNILEIYAEIGCPA